MALRVHIQHLCLTETMVSTLRRVPFGRTQKEPKGPRPIVRPSLRSGSLAPALLRGPAATGHPWPIAALPASMPVDPLRRTSTRPADGASRSKSKARSKAAEAIERPVWMRDLRTTGGLDRQQSFYRVICLPQVTANANPSYFNSPSLLNFAPSILLADLDV